MNANTTFVTMTPDEFVAKFRPYLIAKGARTTTPDDYFVRNTATGKLELHIGRTAYRGLAAEQKQFIRDAFYWGRDIACWTSRADAPDLDLPKQVAESIGLYDAGETSEAPVFSRSHEPVEKPKRRETISPAKPAQAANKPATKAATLGGYLTGEEAEHVLRRGSGFAGGKMRIAAFYASNHTPDEAKSFLKEEYGTGGCSHTFLNGASGFVDYDAKGIEVREWKTDNRIRLSWVSVDSYIRGMIRNGTYLTADEQKTFDAMKAKQRGKLPTPQPRMHYAPADAVA